jgi:hypothetical protein
LKNAESLPNVRRGQDEPSESDDEDDEDDGEQYHRRSNGGGGNARQSKERLLFGASENDDDMYVFASPQQPSQQPGRRNSFRRQLSPRSSNMNQTFQNQTTLDNEYLDDPSGGHNYHRRPLDVVVGAKADDEHLFQAMHSPIKQRKSGGGGGDEDSPENEARRKPITVNRDSTAIIDRANDAAKKVDHIFSRRIICEDIILCWCIEKLLLL